jgi:hypothetical protein
MDGHAAGRGLRAELSGFVADVFASVPRRDQRAKGDCYLRDLPMDSGVLPRVDRQLMLYQRWLTERLAAIEDPEHRRLLRHFASWHQMRRLRSKAEKGPLGRSQTSQAKQEITQTGAFLA